MGASITIKTAIIILATQNKKLINPMLAPWPHGNQKLVPRAEITSITRIRMAWAVPLFWPQPIVSPNAILVANNRHAKSCDPWR